MNRDSPMSGEPYHNYVREVLASNLPAAAKVIQIYLADRADNWSAWPSLTTIQKACRLGLGTVKRCIAILTANGWLTPDPSHEGPSAKRTLSIGSDRPKSGQAQNGLGPNRASARPKKEPTPGPNRATTVLSTVLRNDSPAVQPVSVLVQSQADDSRNCRPAPKIQPASDNLFDTPKPTRRSNERVPASVQAVIDYGRERFKRNESFCREFYEYWTGEGWPRKDWRKTFARRVVDQGNRGAIDQDAPAALPYFSVCEIVTPSIEEVREAIRLGSMR